MSSFPAIHLPMAELRSLAMTFATLKEAVEELGRQQGTAMPSIPAIPAPIADLRALVVTAQALKQAVEQLVRQANAP